MNRQDASNLKEELPKRVNTSEEHAEEITNLDNLEQYSRENSLEFCGTPDEVNLSTDQVV